MLVKDKLDGLFVEMNNIRHLALFDNIKPHLIDRYYCGMYGNRTLSGIAETNSLHDLAEVIIEFFGTKWDSILLQHTLSVESLTEYSEKISETITDNGNNNFTRDNKNQVSAFNDENFVDDKNETETQTTETTNTKTREQIITKLRDTADYKDFIFYLQNDYLCDTIFKDINDISTLQIFS